MMKICDGLINCVLSVVLFYISSASGGSVDRVVIGPTIYRSFLVFDNLTHPLSLE
jgi:hypothetical protein